MGQVQIITGIERRRCWREDEKRAIVSAAFAPGAVVREVARRADISSGLIYRWRRELAGAGGFAAVVVAPPAPPQPDPAVEPMIEVAFDTGARVRLPATASPELAAAIVKALARP
jgi:transposase